MKRISKKAFREEAAKYALIPYPVILFDHKRNAIYFNPAATAESTLSMSEDFLSRDLTPQSIQHIQKCFQSGTPQVFSQSFGRHTPKEFLIDFRPGKPGYVMTLCEKSDTDLKSPLRHTADPDGICMRASLHALLAGSELLMKNASEEVVRRGIQCREQTLRAIRVTRMMDMLEEEPECVIVNVSDLLSLIQSEMAPYIKKRFGRTLKYQKISEKNAIKCCPRHIQHILYGAVSFLLRHTEGDIEMQQSHSPDGVLLTLMAKGYTVGDSAPFLSTATELLRRGQGDLTQEVTRDGLILRLHLPGANAEYTLKEQLCDLLEQNLPINDVEFSEN